jgi:hypothetical protein
MNATYNIMHTGHIILNNAHNTVNICLYRVTFLIYVWQKRYRRKINLDRLLLMFTYADHKPRPKTIFHFSVFFIILFNLLLLAFLFLRFCRFCQHYNQHIRQNIRQNLHYRTKTKYKTTRTREKKETRK